MEPQSPLTAIDPPAVDGFLKNILRSGLLDRTRLQAALVNVPREQRNDARSLANHLIQGGHLSRFQAHKILKGSWRGLVLGPYQVLAPIGRGGMSAVFLARDDRSGELLALKVLPRSRAEKRQRARFRREMRLSQQVDHPHLAATYSAGKIDNIYFIAMEYIPGQSLSRLVNTDGPLDIPRTARLISEVAAGLDYAHNQGLIHRDIKPSNIMVTPRDHAKVLDLGLALIEGEEVLDVTVVGGKGYIVGTMDYIAPEQTTNAATVDRRADIYSLGCTLYFAIAGRPPFPGGTSKEKIRRQRTEEPISLFDLNPALPLPFVLLVQRMMAKDPDDRPYTAAEIVKELRPWAGTAVLPLDCKDDPEYTSAIYALQVEPATDTDGGETRSSFEMLDNTSAETTADKPIIELWVENIRPTPPLWKMALFVVLGLLAAVALVGVGALLVILMPWWR